MNVGRCTHRVLEHIGSADDALSGVGTSSGEALIVAVVRGLELAHSPRDRGDSVRGGRVAAPGVSVTAHLPTIEHVSPQVLCSFHFSSLTHPFLSSLFPFPSFVFHFILRARHSLHPPLFPPRWRKESCSWSGVERSSRDLLELVGQLVSWLVEGEEGRFSEGKERREGIIVPPVVITGKMAGWTIPSRQSPASECLEGDSACLNKCSFVPV